jgi:hypothetical protein
MARRKCDRFHFLEKNYNQFLYRKSTPPRAIHCEIRLQEWLCVSQFAIFACHHTPSAIDNANKSDVYLQTLAFSCKNIAENLLRIWRFYACYVPVEDLWYNAARETRLITGD